MPEPLTYPMTRERQRMGYLMEAAWGTIPAGAPRILPVETPDLRVVGQRVLDSGPRGRWAKDHRSYRTVQEGQASLAGPFYPYLVTPFLGMFFGTESTVASLAVNAGVGADLYMHRYTIAAQPTSRLGLSLFLEDEITGFSATQPPTGTNSQVRVSGFLVPAFNLSFNKAEGLLAWSSDLRGRASTAAFPGTSSAGGGINVAPTFTSTAMNAGATSAVVMPTTNILHGFNASVVIHQNDPTDTTLDPNGAGVAGMTITSATEGLMELQGMEISMERPLTWSYAGGNVRTPSDFALGAPRITFVATLSFQSYVQYRRWLSFNDNSAADDGSDPATYTFGAGLAAAHEQWQVLWVNYPGIVLPTVNTNGLGDVNLEAITGQVSAFNSVPFLNLNDRSALYMEFPEVEYGEAEADIARGEDLITIRLSGLALPDPRNVTAATPPGGVATVSSFEETAVVKVYDALNASHLA